MAKLKIFESNPIDLATQAGNTVTAISIDSTQLPEGVTGVVISERYTGANANADGTVPEIISALTIDGLTSANQAGIGSHTAY